MRNKSYDLDILAKGLDISPTMYKYAVDRYKGIAAYLQKKGITADFSPQGSFRTGTVVRPIKNGKESDYDIDVICKLTYDKDKISAASVKKIIGDALKEDETYQKKLLEEDDRCWILEYAEVVDGIGLFMDVVPAVEENQAGKTRLILAGVDYKYVDDAISITDRKADKYKYLSSNPNGFGNWFDEINERYQNIDIQYRREKIFQENRNLFSSNDTVDDVPDYYLRSILQRAIQLLKRHRDLYFGRTNNLNKYRPASIIITSLASKIAAESSAITLDMLLQDIVQGFNEYASLMEDISPQGRYGEKRNYIEKRSGKWWIPNPVDPEDNYADSWSDETAKAFFRWVKTVSMDLIDPTAIEEQRYLTGLQTSFGKDYVGSKLGLNDRGSRATAQINRPTKPWGFSNDV